MMNKQLQKLFSQTYILGGSPCSGKSTIAGKLSARFHLNYYKVDDHFQEHVKRCNPEMHPVMHKISKMGWNEIWSRPVSVLVKEELEYYRELFGMILQDLGKYESDWPLIVEGAALLPELINRTSIDPDRVLYMVPTKEFQIHHYSQREFIQYILKDCKDPEAAFDNWMMRDHLFGKEILRQAQIFGFRTIIVDEKKEIAGQFKDAM
ncbi:hypothetical protein ACFLXI_09390, partial [Chloroflexota bacterium]